jgi:serine protease Do
MRCGRFAVAAVAILAFGVVAGAAAQNRTSPRAPESDMSAMLRDAQNFTVKVRSTVTWPIQGDRFGTGQGTGFIIDKARGWILTNAHVARSSPGAVDIAFGDAETDWVAAERVYVDNLLDVAVLKLAPERFPPGMTEAKLGCERSVEQGAAVVAYGHPRDLNFTATRGIVSSIRTLGALEFIQMDASLNPGNSGGALLAVGNAEVIGVTTATAGSGLGFATPMRHICPMLALLRAGKDPAVPTLPVYWLKSGAAETLTVAKSFPDAAAGLPMQRGDQALGLVGGPRFGGLPDLHTALRGRTGMVGLVVRRNGADLEVSVPILPGEAPMQRQALALSGMVIDDDRRVDAEPSVLPRLHIDFMKQGETAERAGFRVGDAFAEIGGRVFNTVPELHDWLKTRPAGEIVQVLVRRRIASASGLSAEYVRLDLKVEQLALLSGSGD